MSSQGYPGEVAIPVNDGPGPAQSGGGSTCCIVVVIVVLLTVVAGVFGFLWWRKLPPFAKKEDTPPVTTEGQNKDGPTPTGQDTTNQETNTLTDEQKIRAGFKEGSFQLIGKNKKVQIVGVIPAGDPNTKQSYEVQLPKGRWGKTPKIETWPEDELYDKVSKEKQRIAAKEKEEFGFRFEIGEEVKPNGILAGFIFMNEKGSYKPKTATVAERKPGQRYRLEGENGIQIYFMVTGILKGAFIEDKAGKLERFCAQDKLLPVKPATRSVSRSGAIESEEPGWWSRWIPAWFLCGTRGRSDGRPSSD